MRERTIDRDLKASESFAICICACRFQLLLYLFFLHVYMKLKVGWLGDEVRERLIFFPQINSWNRCRRRLCCCGRRRRRRVYDDSALKSHCQCEYKIGAHNLWWLHANATQESGRERKRRKRNVYVPLIWALVGMFMSLCMCVDLNRWPLNIFCW